jgi:hypothetical protein
MRQPRTTRSLPLAPRTLPGPSLTRRIRLRILCSTTSPFHACPPIAAALSRSISALARRHRPHASNTWRNQEIRVQDYAQNRKTANAAPAAGAFGQPAAGGGLFGQQANTAAPGGFGTFGQTTQPTQPAQPAAPAFGAFGQQSNAQQPAPGAFGTFGQQAQPAQPAPAAFGGGFGQTNPQQPAPAGGLFGGGGGTAGGAFGT